MKLLTLLCHCDLVYTVYGCAWLSEAMPHRIYVDVVPVYDYLDTLSALVNFGKRYADVIDSVK